MNEFKKYQIFISSTYQDLKDERRAIADAILEENHIPAGMEMFSASHKTQWEYISKIISECDYYILIIAGKYGSIYSESGVSFTEQEYLYALEQNIPIMAFILADEADDKIEKNLEKLRELNSFKEKIKSNGRMCQFFTDKNDLKSKFKTSLHQYIADHPRAGWVRSDSYAIQERILVNDLDFIDTFLFQHINLLKHSIFTSFNRDGTDFLFSAEMELNFNNMFNMFNPSILMSRVGKKVFEVFVGELQNTKNSIQQLLNNSHINIKYELSKHFLDYLQIINIYISVFEELKIYSSGQNQRITATVIGALKTSQPEYKQSSAINIFVSYFKCITYIHLWILNYEKIIQEIKSKNK
jgi:hypothetical protein